MDQHIWEHSTDALAMLETLFPQRGENSTEPQPRSSRLYLIACGRRAWDRLPGVCRTINTLAERIFAQARTDKHLRDRAYSYAESLFNCPGEAEDVNEIADKLVAAGFANGEEHVVEDFPPNEWAGYARLTYYPFYPMTPDYRHIPPDLHSADLVRTFFGNPLAKKPRIDPAWRTTEVIALARSADQSVDPLTLGVLADALEEAGCDRFDVLNHLRGDGPHARGCWVLSDLLGWK